MGLDAFVRCRCFEEGLVSEPPLPMEDLYVDDEGFVWSRTFDRERERLGWEEFSRRYGDLEDRLWRWCDTCCVHERMHVCSEWVANSSGWSQLQWLFEQLGERTPTLAEMLPNGNGGFFPAELAERALAELDLLEREVPNLMPERCTMLIDCFNGLPRLTHRDGEASELRRDSFRFADGKLYVRNGRWFGEEPLEAADFVSAHFRATLVEDVMDSCCSAERNRVVLLEDLDGTGRSHRMGRSEFCRADSDFCEKPVEYRVVEDSDEEWARWKIGIIRKLLVASLETGNPIQWF